jgi:hypothetical protein
MTVYKIGEVYVKGVNILRENNKYIHQYIISKIEDEIQYIPR